MYIDKETAMGGVGRAFMTTHWSLIEDAGCSDDDKNTALIELLLKKYWKPVYCYVRRRGHPNEEAKDLTQGFFHEVVLSRNLLGKADRTKGRFRSFLLTALNHYLINVHHKQAAKRHIPKARLVGMSMDELSELPQAVTTLTPEDSFTYAWVSALLEEVLANLKAAYEQADRRLHWQIFRDRTLRPIMEGRDAPSLESVCRTYGVSDTAKASNMILTVKRRFQTLIRQHLRDLVMSDREAEEELQEISRFLPNVMQDGA
jgi:DNA-directed RNA polymerase specialized sigma24 family protein